MGIQATVLLALLLVCAVGCGPTRPDVTDTLTQGDHHFSKQEYNEAATEYLEAIRKDPRNADARCKLGDLCLKIKDIDNANFAYKQVHQLDPDYPGIRQRFMAVLDARLEKSFKESVNTPEWRFRQEISEGLRK